MEQPTVEKRFELYNTALECYIAAQKKITLTDPLHKILVSGILNAGFGICNILIVIYYKEIKIFDAFDYIPNHFPELMMFKPEDVLNVHTYWFTTIDERITVLRKCSEMCLKAMKNETINNKLE